MKNKVPEMINSKSTGLLTRLQGTAFINNVRLYRLDPNNLKINGLKMQFWLIVETVLHSFHIN